MSGGTYGYITGTVALGGSMPFTGSLWLDIKAEVWNQNIVLCGISQLQNCSVVNQALRLFWAGKIGEVWVENWQDKHNLQNLSAGLNFVQVYMEKQKL